MYPPGKTPSAPSERQDDGERFGRAVRQQQTFWKNRGFIGEQGKGLRVWASGVPNSTTVFREVRWQRKFEKAERKERRDGGSQEGRRVWLCNHRRRTCRPILGYPRWFRCHWGQRGSYLAGTLRVFWEFLNNLLTLNPVGKWWVNSQCTHHFDLNGITG